MATPRVTIDQLPVQATAEVTNELIIQDTGVTKRMSVATLQALPSQALTDHLNDTTDAHDATAISTTSSGTGVDGVTVQAQLEQLAALANGKIDQAAADTRYANVDGDTLTGFLTLNAEPTAALHAATKQYVDDNAGGGGTVSDVVWVGNDPPIDPNVELWWDTDQYTTGALKVLVASGDWRLVSDLTALDARYVNADGDTMVGSLTIDRPGASTQLILKGDQASRQLLAQNAAGASLGVLSFGDSNATVGSDVGALALRANGASAANVLNTGIRSAVAQGTNAADLTRKDYVDGLTGRCANRFNRAAYNLPNGDADHLGTYQGIESITPSGSWSGSGTTGTPLLVPLTGTYAILMTLASTAWPGTTFSTLSAVVIGTPYGSHYLPLMFGTTNRVGGATTCTLVAGDAITFRVRNNTGATVNNVTLQIEVTRISP